MKDIIKLRLRVMLPIIAVGMIIDQLSKVWAVNYLLGGPRFSFLFDTVRILYAENLGAFLGMGNQLPPHLRFWLLTAVVGVFLLGLLIYLLIGKGVDRLSLMAMTLVFTGGFSNFIDRAMNDGAVVDFLNMGIGGFRTGIFNFADVYIMIGAGMMIIGPWILERKQKRSER